MSGQPNPSVAYANTGSFGFSFVLEGNGGGTGTNPKTYSIADPNILFLKGVTNDNAPGVSVQWPSDPGDFPNSAFPAPPNRQYDPEVSPNNIRLSQVSIDSLTATHGIRPSPQQASLPSSYGFTKDPSVPAIPPLVGDLQGIRKLTVSLLARRDGAPFLPDDMVLLCNSIMIYGAANIAAPSPGSQKHTFEFTNLGNVQIVNLSAVRLVIGVHCELYM